ncbi:MAG: magnesium transporter [Spirochaetes bacterium GWF1_51_8]|nr:MAG: magnesium transporter [Spirochaetes bacterium GWF1_51_8]
MIESNREYLAEQIEQGQLKSARNLLVKLEPKDIALVIGRMTGTEKILAFRVLPQEIAVEVFAYFEAPEQEEFLGNFTNREAKQILDNMHPDDRTDLFEELPAIVVRKLLKLLSPEERTVANQLLDYKEDTAGRIMTPEYVDLELGMTAAQAMKQIKKEAPDKETIYTNYIVDESGILVGVASLKNIILAPAEKLVSDIMEDNPIKVTTDTPQETAAKMIKNYDILAVPVVDLNGRLVGIVTVDDVIDVLEEENTEDFQKIAGIQPTDEGYIKSGFFRLVFNRSLWLVILLFVASVTQDVIKAYSGLLNDHLALSFFFTLLVGVGGNIGSQSSILVIRGLATGEITKKDTFRLLLRSLTVGLTMGAILAGFMLLRILVFGTGSDVKWVVSVALAALVTLANFLGAMLPLVIKKIGIDPALVSAPLITTLIDVGGLVLYFEIARALLGAA